MARIRTVKPDFFRHELLQDMEQSHPQLRPMLVFAALWGHCDKAGNFEWKPRSLKLDILPFLTFDIADTLALLNENGLISRYFTDGKEFGHVPNFGEHQRIGGKEATDPARFPGPPSGSNGEATGKQQGRQEGKGREGNKEGKGKGKFPTMSLGAWLIAIGTDDAVPAADPIFKWADKTGIPREWIGYAWAAFEDRYIDKPDKVQADWRGAFRDHVKRGWLDCWRLDNRTNALVLTTVGDQWRRAACA